MLLVIAVLIAVASFVHGEWKQLQASRTNAGVLVHVLDEAGRHQQQEAAAVQSRVDLLRRGSIEALRSRIAVLKSRQLPVPASPPSLLSLTLDGRGISAYYRQRVTDEILRQELAYTELLYANASALFERDAARARLNALHAAHVQLYARYLANKRLRDELNWVDAQRINVPLLSDERLAALETERVLLVRANKQAGEAVELQRDALSRIKAIEGGQLFRLDQARLDEVMAPVRQAHARAETTLAAHWAARLLHPVVDALPLAALVLLSGFAAHFLLKVLFYYVLAPLAARCKPIRLDAVTGGQIAARGGAVVSSTALAIDSGVAQTVILAAGEEMLVLPDYIQSSSVQSKMDTKWLLDWAFPWTSLISGLFALTRIRSTGADERIVLSASADPLSEIALIVIPAGSAMVFQPRGLVGVIYPCAAPLKIARYWRLGSLHAWLTLQLRYIVFRGPVTLIVSGTRGVRVEAAGDGRMISQASTLGFSANVAYATYRCETFFPFYLGKTALLQDSFSGGSGYYVYDETPRAGKKAGLFERGLEGVVDAVLKVFGI